MTDTEYDGRIYEDELNDDALEVCRELSRRRGFERDDCLKNYESGLWLDHILWSRNRPWLTPGLPCR